MTRKLPVLALAVLVVSAFGCIVGEQELECGRNYTPRGKVCCLDRNANGICDVDEFSSYYKGVELVDVNQETTTQQGRKKTTTTEPAKPKKENKTWNKLFMRLMVQLGLE